MALRSLALALLSALLLAACGVPSDSPPGAAAPTSAASGQATAAPAPATTAPQPAATAPAPTAPPPTQAPQPTLAPATPIPPTDAPRPTATPQPAATSAPTPQPTTAPPSGVMGGEILFLRQGALWAFDVATRQERRIVEGVRDFVATPDGSRLALIRGEGTAAEIWLARRDGSELAQLTHNTRVEASLSWAPDGTALVFASSVDRPYAREWHGWSHWCATSEVRLFDLASGAEGMLAAGCDPAFSPDGRRIAYAAPPTASEVSYPDPVPLIANSVRLINRQGQNGWDFARADGTLPPGPRGGRLVYAPAFSPDGAQVLYHRFVGYQALVDLDLSEIGGSFKGQGQLMSAGAGWLLPARFAPDGATVAISEDNFSDARGFGGYDNWAVRVIHLSGTRSIPLPYGEQPALGQEVERLPRGQAVAWAPDGSALAVQLPPGWRPGIPNDQPIEAGDRPGEIWRWRPGNPPEERLVQNVDFASPLAWLP